MQIAQTTDVEFVEQIKSDTTKCISFVPTPFAGRTVCLTNTGFGILTRALNMLWGNDKWNEYILGIRDVEDLYYQYYEDYDATLQARNIYSQGNDNDRSISSSVEEIGPWCTHWYDVKERGFRNRLRTIYD